MVCTPYAVHMHALSSTGHPCAIPNFVVISSQKLLRSINYAAPTVISINANDLPGIQTLEEFAMPKRSNKEKVQVVTGFLLCIAHSTT